jgi:uncharacterized membrane protein (Fun14 family)
MIPEHVQLGIEIGGGAVLGYLTGFASKKLTKLVAVIVGVQLIVLAALEAEGIISARWAILSELVAKTDIDQQLSEQVLSLAGVLPVGGGFIAGFYAGFKRG